VIEQGLDASKIHTVHNAVDTDYFDPDTKVDFQPSVRERFNIPAGAPLVGIAARMNPWKGQLELIGAASLLRDKFPDLHVVIVGTDVPDVRAVYERKAKEGGVFERLHFAGFQRDVRPFLQEFDLFVHPSYGEPFSLVLLEAMAMRKPVIACGTGGTPEMITHDQDGWLVRERSDEDVAVAISTLLKDPARAEKIAQRAWKTPRDRFTPRHQCANMERQYVSLVAAN
jgi:glycosyltransferase involved in cell wall biosynthesis